MSGTNNVSGSGNIKKPVFIPSSLRITSVGKSNLTTPLEFPKSDNKEIGLRLLDTNNFGKFNIDTSNLTKIANDVNATMLKLGFNYKVTNAQVRSVQKSVDNAQQNLNLAYNDATGVRAQRVFPPLDEALANAEQARKAQS
ncbi:hypothetical protein J6I39_01400 [bacterium]|nr:hypothetical protein [bacterium]